MPHSTLLLNPESKFKFKFRDALLLGGSPEVDPSAFNFYLNLNSLPGTTSRLELRAGTLEDLAQKWHCPATTTVQTRSGH